MKKKSFKGGILLATVLLFVRLLTSASNVFAADDEYDPYGGVSYKAYDTYARVETIDPGPGILGDIHIRDTYNGKPVTYIQWNALFRYSTYPQANVKLRSITFPDTLSVVENRLFDGCTNLISVKANNLTVIGGEGFRNCFALKDIDISKVKSIYNQGFYN